MKIPYLPLNKAIGIRGGNKSNRAKGQEQQDKSTSIVPDFSKTEEDKSKDKDYKPAVMRGLPEPPGEGDVIEFHHPKHGMKTRGRVTAVGQDGYRARIADGSALDIPHSHTIAKLPVGDYGAETGGVSPQDAKDSFLGPTKEGGIPATPLQIAVMDVLSQYGFPIDEDSIHTINYDQARRVITKYLMDDRSTNEMPDSGQDDYEAAQEDSEGGQEDSGGEDGSEGSPDDPDSEDSSDEEEEEEGQDQGMGEASGGDTDEDQGESSEVTGGQQPGSMTPGTAPGATGAQSKPQPHVDGTDMPGGPVDLPEDEVMADPEVIEAVKALIGALQTTSLAPGTPDEETTGHKEAKKHPNVKKKIEAVVNASSKRVPPRKTQGA